MANFALTNSIRNPHSLPVSIANSTCWNSIQGLMNERKFWTRAAHGKQNACLFTLLISWVTALIYDFKCEISKISMATFGTKFVNTIDNSTIHDCKGNFRCHFSQYRASSVYTCLSRTSLRFTHVVWGVIVSITLISLFSHTVLSLFDDSKHMVHEDGGRLAI